MPPFQSWKEAEEEEEEKQEGLFRADAVNEEDPERYPGGGRFIQS